VYAFSRTLVSEKSPASVFELDLTATFEKTAWLLGFKRSLSARCKSVVPVLLVVELQRRPDLVELRSRQMHVQRTKRLVGKVQ